MGIHSLLQRIFPTQGSNLGLAHCRQILYHLVKNGGSPQSVVVLCFRFTEFTEKIITACTPKTRTIPPKNLAASEADFGTGCEVRVRGVPFTFHSVQKAVVLATVALKQETQLLWFPRFLVLERCP